jgi:hypothetical protein
VAADKYWKAPFCRELCLECVMNWYGNEANNTWDSHITKALTSAYDDALVRAKELGILRDKGGRAASDIIARHIIEGAKRGKYDPQILADGAIEYLRRG